VSDTWNPVGTAEIKSARKQPEVQVWPRRQPWVERRTERWWGFRRLRQVTSGCVGWRCQLWLGYLVVQFDWMRRA
jgi:hypothetical protein